MFYNKTLYLLHLKKIFSDGTHKRKLFYCSTKQGFQEKKHLTLGFRKHTTTLKLKLVHDIWSRESCLVGRGCGRDWPDGTKSFPSSWAHRRSTQFPAFPEGREVPRDWILARSTCMNIYTPSLALFFVHSCWLAECRGTSREALQDGRTTKWKALDLQITTEKTFH